MINAGHQRAMFAVTTKGNKDPKRGGAPATESKTDYYCLSEGDAEGPLQLVKIGKGGDEVDIINSGNPMKLTMKENGFLKESSPEVAARLE